MSQVVRKTEEWSVRDGINNRVQSGVDLAALESGIFAEAGLAEGGTPEAHLLQPGSTALEGAESLIQGSLIQGSLNQGSRSDGSRSQGSRQPAAQAQQTAALRVSSAPYAVQLEFFSGPMDLLLHLVARQEVPIEQVSMAQIAEQYLELVSRQAHRLDLEQASEFLVIAATLLSIKSASLLPAEPKVEEENLGPWQDGNPFFESLRARIQEYQLTQARAAALRRLPQLGVHTFSRMDRRALQPTPKMLQEPEDAYSLGKLFAGLLKRIGKVSSGITITLHAVSVVSVMVKIVDGFQALFGIASDSADGAVEDYSKRPRVGFLHMLQTVVPRKERTAEPRSVVISGFVAVLELAKRGLLSASQTDSEGLMVGPPAARIVLPTAEDPLTSEFDLPPADDFAEDFPLLGIGQPGTGRGLDGASRGQSNAENERPQRVDNVVHIRDYLPSDVIREDSGKSENTGTELTEEEETARPDVRRVNDGE